MKDFSAASGLCAVIAVVPFAGAAAQEVEPPSDHSVTSVGIEEIVVTAQKRESNLQDTALAISAFSGASMEAKGIDDLANLESYIPNFHVGQEQDGVKVALRGVGLQGTSSITDPGVAFYIDGLYIPRPAGGSAIFYDTDRIEVLRGPQGTLYGRNATGGVVNVISKRPSSEFEAQAGVSYGSRDLIEARGLINIPFSDTVAARVSAVRTEEDGYHENLSTAPGADDFYGTEDLTLRGQLLFDNDDLELLWSGSYSDLNGTGLPYTYLEPYRSPIPPVNALYQLATPEPSDPLVTINNNESFKDIETASTFATIKKSFGGVDAFLQAGWFHQNTDLVQDFDGSDQPVSIFTKEQENEAESVEFRLSSNSGERVEWIVGAYYFSEDTYIFRRVQLNGLTPMGMISLPDFLLDEWGDSSTLAGFGSATWSVSDTFRLTTGARYTEDEKSGSKITRSNFGQPLPPDVPNAAYPGEADFSETTWKVGLEWDAGENVLLYTNVSNGYKAGGFNITSNGQPYDPETVMAYEAGVKSNPFDGRAQINVDLFYYAYDDMQLTTLTTVNNAPGQLTTNAAQSTIYGIELDTQFELTDSFLLMASYAYIDATFDEYFNTDPRDPNPPFNPNDPAGLGRTDLSGNRVPYVPEHTISLGLQYELELGEAGSLTGSVSSAWHDELYMREYNVETIDKQDSNSKTDVSLMYSAGDTGLKITGYATNLEDESELTNIYITPGFIGPIATAQYSKPRTYGVRLDYAF
jgi:iron complex outermembrane receptor protein